MKIFRLLLISLVAVALFAQSPSSVQQTAQKLDAALYAQTTATTATTLTMTPPAGQSVYIWQVDIQNCQDATGISADAAPTSITTTNLGSLAWQMGSGITTNVGICEQTFSVSYPTGLKSTVPGTAVTFVTPTYITHQEIRINVVYSFAP